MTAWRFLFLSLAVHLLIWFIMLNKPNFKFPNQDKSVEVTLVEKPKHPSQIVRQTDIPLDMLKPEPPKDPKYLSEKDQNVKKETKAQNSGITRNGNSNINEPDTKEKPRKGGGGTPHVVDGSDLGKFAPNPMNGPPGPSIPNRPSPHRMSSNGEYLPDVANGPITALNSERFIYYSFFARNEERLRPIWERNVENAMQRLPASVQKSMIGKSWNTSLEVLLDGEGHYIDTIIHQSCGVHEIDMAAVNAFVEAKFFPNPPKEMIKADQRIHLDYMFNVQWGSGGWGR
jgi:TonB family protein